jgi:hypothetical protein
MSVRSSESVTVTFYTNALGGGPTNASSTPTGTLYVNGSANGATVTVTNIGTGTYTAQVTLPTLSIGQQVQVGINATVSGVTQNAIVWADTCDVALDSSGDVTFNNTTLSSVGTVTAAVSITGDLSATMKASIGTVVASSAVASVAGNVGGSVGSVIDTVQANVAEVNGVTVAGAGTSGNPWGPA